MSGRNSDERLFSEDVERLLRGEETLPSRADREYDETIRFARRLLALREEPRSEFTSTLRQRLLTGMAEQDLAASQRDTRSWFGRFFGQPGLRLALVSTFVVIAAVGLVWRAGLLSMLPGQPAAGTPAGVVSDNGLVPPAAPAAGEPAALMAPQGEEDASQEARAMTPLAVQGYVAPTNTYGDRIVVSLLFSNSGTEGMMLSPFPPEVSIRDVANEQTVYTFAPGTSQLALSSMESTTYDISWDQRDNDGAQVLPGTYAVDVWAMQSRLEKGIAGESPAAPGVVTFEVLPEEDTASAADSGATNS